MLQLGLEGLVLKDLESIYEPGKRHWLKVKKDYLFDGAMADTADLVVLGAWFGKRLASTENVLIYQKINLGMDNLACCHFILTISKN